MARNFSVRRAIFNFSPDAFPFLAFSYGPTTAAFMPLKTLVTFCHFLTKYQSRLKSTAALLHCCTAGDTFGSPAPPARRDHSAWLLLRTRQAPPNPPEGGFELPLGPDV